MPTLSRNFLKDVWKLIRAYWRSDEKWRARLLLAVIVALNLGQVYILVLLNKWNNRFYNSLQNYDRDGFFSLLGEFSLLAAMHIIVAVYMLYLRQLLEINWRRWLTGQYLGRWLNGQTYYRMQLLNGGTDNPDQRISEDLNLFVRLTLQLSVGLLRAMAILISFIVILWELSGTMQVPLGDFKLVIPGYLVWTAIIYAIAGTWLTAKIGRPLIGFNYNQQRYEADFRFSLIRLRENSESIAFYKGEAQEDVNFARRFARVVENFRTIMIQQKKLTWFTSAYGQIAIIFPILVVAPRYFSGQLKLGGLMQTASAFAKVQDALSFFVDSYTALAEWRAVVNRLLGFIGNIEDVGRHQQRNGICVDWHAHHDVSVDALNVMLPDGSILIENLDLTIEAGDRLLIVGQSGRGKSTLLRALAGMWPFGKGQIGLPKEQGMLFLPQKPYLPEGTLREVMLYPYGEAISDGQIKEVMLLCRIGHLRDRLGECERWSHILSLGEQQRIAFARALLLKPKWLFLDEATSALDEPTERLLYRQLEEQLADAAIVSIGHRNTLAAYHKAKLSLDGSGRWSLLKL